jgi:hypothetical protein
MRQPVKAEVRLKCKIQWSGPVELEIHGFTRELARDHVVVEAGMSTDPGPLWLGRRATLAIELPPFRLQTPRVLECDGTVAGFRVAEGHAQVELAIDSMSFAGIGKRRRVAANVH